MSKPSKEAVEAARAYKVHETVPCDADCRKHHRKLLAAIIQSAIDKALKREREVGDRAWQLLRLIECLCIDGGARLPESKLSAVIRWNTAYEALRKERE